MNIQFVWDETKRLTNLKDHGLDFLVVRSVFEGRTATLEDDRFDYGERRLITLSGTLEQFRFRLCILKRTKKFA